MLKELVAEKSKILLRVETLRGQKGKRREIRESLTRAAALEARIARIYHDNGQYGDAAISKISQASCFFEIGRKIESRRLYEMALASSPGIALSSWIQEEVSKLRDIPSKVPSIFATLTPHVHGNAELRRPQVEAYSAVANHFEQSNSPAIVQLPVGCGKTGTMSLIPFGLAKNARVLAVAPNVEIRRNLHNNLNYASPQSFWRNRGVLRDGKYPHCAVLDGDANISDADRADIIVTNIQQLASQSQKWMSQLSPDYFDLIMLDEGHHNVAKTWRDVLAHFDVAKVASFTATPFRSDGKKVDGVRVYTFPIADAIREGYIKDLAARKLEPTSIHFTYQGDTHTHSLDEVLALREEEWFSRGVALSKECNQHIVDASIEALRELRSLSSGKQQVIGVACSVDHAKAVCSLYRERKYRAKVVHSKQKSDENAQILGQLDRGELDVVIQVGMLGEGADYPNLSVAAIFRPYRHVAPYVQFIGRIMRVIEQSAPGHPANRGYVISHVGLNVDRWWEELKQFDAGDEQLLREIATGEKVFQNDSGSSEGVQPYLFRPEMVVLAEEIVSLSEEKFLDKDYDAQAEDLIVTLRMRGVTLESLGLSEDDLKEKIRARSEESSRIPFVEQPVDAQFSRKEARRRLDERVKAAAKRILSSFGLSIAGRNLAMKFPDAGRPVNNLATAIILTNIEVNEYLGVDSSERGELSAEMLNRAYDNIDEIAEKVSAKITERMQ